MTTTITDRLVPVADVARRLGIIADDITRGAWDVPIFEDWSGRPSIKETDAARLRDKIRAREEAERQRTREDDAQRTAERDQLDKDRERRYWSAFACVVEHSDARDAKVFIRAAATALEVIGSDDPEEALRAVVRTFGEPSDEAIMYVMGRSKRTSATGKAKGRPSWLR